MNIEFKINKFSLIQSAIKSGELEKVNRLLWKDFCNEPAFYFLNPKHLDWSLEEIFIQSEKEGFKERFLKLAENLEKILKEASKSNKFKKILSETERYKKLVEGQWNDNKELVLSFFKNELGLKIPNYTITVFVFPPEFCKGRMNPDKKYILWGHKEDWENYSTVYLAHEILHILVDKNCKNKNLMHAIIELATDNELRIRLNKEGRYFKEGKLKVGHQHLKKIEKKIFPQWKKYLKKPGNKNIFILEKEIKKLKYKI
ncbi:MAG: hypothetical protein GF387_02310 [Candidatus Portnoybacteria bacterium]|nr:hypothetical protein [Candidatus Portnoybacteria bacterium]